MRCKTIRYREFWGATKRADLLATLEKDGDAFDGDYAVLTPNATNRFSLRPAVAGGLYPTWTAIPSLAAEPPHNGPVERRGLALIDPDRSAIERRMAAYFDAKATNEAVKALHPSLMMTGNRIDGPAARKKLLAEATFEPRRIVRYPWKPFDTRWCYLDNIRPLFSEPSPVLIERSRLPEQAFFATRDDSDTPDEGPPGFFSARICDYDFLRGHARLFPILLPASGEGVLPTGGTQFAFDYGANLAVRPNLSPAAIAWLAALGLPADAASSRLVWLHALATTYSPAYLAENALGVRQGWPRIPLPDTAEALRASAALGARLAALLDPDTEIPGVTTGTPNPALAGIAVPATAPGATRDWRLTRWGNPVMREATLIVQPARGRAEARAYAESEAATAAHSALLGARTCDVWLNGSSLWRNIPEKVWETTIGGYQVLKKWLSYRDAAIINRALTEAEVAHVQATARRLAAILLMGPELDASFRACAAAHRPLPS